MEFIPTLTNDLRAISELALNVEEESGGNDIKSHQPEKQSLVPVLDLNSLPCSDSEIEENDQNVSENKKRRAAKTEDIARLSLEDLAKYFDLTIVEASKKLKVGVTVLKRKCREFGIPRWPRRKIKSLDSLILDLQKEMQQQQEEDELAAIAVEERKRMIECERESIEKKPFMDIQEETKKFRQVIFKRRYKARVLENRCRKLSLL
ncbi:protein RKD5 isoform X4 [Lycium ferocissimum]|uniref:protein RKD5 isoform X4 n=1 Tax=Lycium ferocissimum TaxID=112874 RepID=UPI0028150277|nr:protein RKD5 isoform X4 [Lycium ferocissimum]